jgi:signal peptidase II
MITSHKIRLAVLLFLLTCTVGCDQLSKHVARTGLGSQGSLSLPAGLGELKLVENAGAFLSLGASLSPASRVMCFTIAVGIGLTGLFFFLLSHSRLSLSQFTALALILAGGTSNLIDRILRHGLVTDFITIRVGPLHTGVFNVADMMVMLGLGLLMLAHLNRRKVVDHEKA